MAEPRHFALHISNAREIPHRQDESWVVFSDLHMGNGGRRDDFAENAQLFQSALTEYYLPRGYGLILNGDVEELHKFTWHQIREHWTHIYRVFDAFAEKDKFLKTVGNHDSRLIMDLRDYYPYRIDMVLRMTGLEFPVLIYHGHQVSAFYEKHNDIGRIGIRYFAMPLGIMNYSVAHDSRKRHRLEKRIYAYSRREQVVSVIGHTHRPLFESLTEAETMRFRLEFLLGKCRIATPERRKSIEEEIVRLRHDLVELRSRKGRSELQSGIYANEDVPVPCLFNSGAVMGKRGMTCLEFSKGKIRLVHWSGRPFNNRPTDGRKRDSKTLLGGRIHYRRLREVSIDYVMDSLRLLI